jgi:hypothetical protein
MAMLLVFFLERISGQVMDPNQTPFAYGGGIGGYICSAQPNQQGMTSLNKRPVAGFSFGGMVSVRKSKYFFETGINYVSEGYAYSSNVTVRNTTKTVSDEYKFYSLMVPLRICLPVKSTFCIHLPSFAFNLSYRTKQTQLETIDQQNGPLNKNVYDIKKDYKDLTPSFTLAYGVEFDLNEVHAIRIEPACQFSFINARQAGNKTTISNLGLRAYFLFLR